MSTNVTWRDIMDWNSAILWGLIGIASTIFLVLFLVTFFIEKDLSKKR